MASNPYMAKTEALLREGRAALDGLRAKAEKASAEARVDAGDKIKQLEVRYADVSRRFEQLRAAGAEGVADLKVGLEKAWDAFRSEMGWKSLEER
jgi:hypothetical protein